MNVLRLPNVDEFRQPFIEPLGHLVMQAAYADNELIELCSKIPSEGSPHQMPPEEVAQKLRNWDQKAKAFVHLRINMITDDRLRDQASDALTRFDTLRTQRHRAIHDAVEVGIFGSGDTYEVSALALEYRREKSCTTVSLNTVTPEVIANLACQLYELQRDLNSVTYALTRVEGYPSN
ncbi:hypothetical protein J2857_000757 [Neorhizobium galegae]|uniref:hypothetical protein n=1 Tax=Neorhizobium galegae TaxID=399 RepID=UPI001AE25238|nr:hypothetical protein [Neorhizobium galegae]MBP2558006.1 hypothetical protein [Neorhizobium galegae]